MMQLLFLLHCASQVISRNTYLGSFNEEQSGLCGTHDCSGPSNYHGVSC